MLPTLLAILAALLLLVVAPYLAPVLLSALAAVIAVTLLLVLAATVGTKSRASPAVTLALYTAPHNGPAIQVLSTEVATVPAIYYNRPRGDTAGARDPT